MFLIAPDADTSRLSGFSADSSPTNPSTRDSSPIKISGNKEMPSEYHGMGSVHNSTHHSKADNGFSSPSVQDGAAAPYTPSNSDSETGDSESGSNCDDSCSSAVQLILDQVRLRVATRIELMWLIIVLFQLPYHKDSILCRNFYCLCIYRLGM